MHTKEDVQSAVKNALKRVTGIEILSERENLLKAEVGIAPAKFLYVFDELQEGLQLPVYEIFKNQTFVVMSVENLSTALFELQAIICGAEVRT